MAVTGVIENLDLALREYLAAYQPGALGLDGVGGCVISLPIPDWATFSWMENPAASVPAGSSVDLLVFTVPENERIWMQYFIGERTTGDNTLNGLNLVWPADYRNGTAPLNICTPTVAVTRLFWPDVGGILTLESQVGQEPILMEPGTGVYLSPSGAGASVSTFNVVLLLKRTKLIRAQAPY